MSSPGAGVLAAVRAHIRPTGDGHRVTSLELFFDLVFVYAITNISALMEHEVGVRTAVEGAVVLSMVWFGWASYAWLGNQARADEGLLRVAVVVATGAMFFVAISIPYTFTEDSNAAWVLVVAYAVVRLVHNGVYLIATLGDRQVNSVVRGMVMVTLVVFVPLSIGAAVPAHQRLWWWVVAVVIDQLGVYFVRSTRWRLSSASHFAERFGNIVLIAIGESVVGLGVATSVPHLTPVLTGDLVAGLGIAVCLWWTYFDIVAIVAERTLTCARDLDRARLARDTYTYLHLPVVGGVVYSAMGIGLVVHHQHPLAGCLALNAGIAVYLVTLSALRRRDIGRFNPQRLLVAVLLLALIPVDVHLPAPVQLGVPAALLAALVAFETAIYRDVRRRVRDEQDGPAPEPDGRMGGSPA